MQGAILDVAVDIRKGSPTFGRHVSVELNSNEQISLWVPEGFAHGFQALEDSTRVHYKVTNYWNKDSEKSLKYNCTEVGINWYKIKHIVSEKDLLAQSLSEM
jgi:dTDP-4-dehydrorhamnose 3,5-epimerase